MRQFRYVPTGERVRIVGVANEGQKEPGDRGRGMRLYAVESVLDPARNGSVTPPRWQAAASELRWVDAEGKPRLFTDALFDQDQQEVHERTARAVLLRDVWALSAPALRLLGDVADGRPVEPSEARAACTSLREARSLLREVLDEELRGHVANS